MALSISVFLNLTASLLLGILLLIVARYTGKWFHDSRLALAIRHMALIAVFLITIRTLVEVVIDGKGSVAALGGAVRDVAGLGRTPKKEGVLDRLADVLKWEGWI